MEILLLDNYDSFTFNLYQQMVTAGAAQRARVTVVRNDEQSALELLAMDWDALVISPGPGGPKDCGVCGDLVIALGGVIPILGVCLGHQLIAHLYGGRVVHAKTPIHGKSLEVKHDGRGIFANVPSPFRAARYHSLAVDEATLPAQFTAQAWAEDGELMAFSNESTRMYAVQFHPESFLTEHGHTLMSNFLALFAPPRQPSSRPNEAAQ